MDSSQRMCKVPSKSTKGHSRVVSDHHSRFAAVVVQVVVDSNNGFCFGNSSTRFRFSVVNCHAYAAGSRSVASVDVVVSTSRASHSRGKGLHQDLDTFCYPLESVSFQEKMFCVPWSLLAGYQTGRTHSTIETLNYYGSSTRRPAACQQNHYSCCLVAFVSRTRAMAGPQPAALLSSGGGSAAIGDATMGVGEGDGIGPRRW